jgi:hypothetical protein
MQNAHKNIFTSFPCSFHIKHFTLLKAIHLKIGGHVQSQYHNQFYKNLSLSSKDLHVSFECHKEGAKE